MSKVISFCGFERGDIVYYIAAMLTKNGNSVLVIDNSYNNDVYGAATNFDDEYEKDYVIKQNITYIKNVNYNTDTEEVYDFVIIWQGMNIKEEALMQSEYVYLQSDFSPMSLKALKGLISDRDNLSGVIARESVESNKITEKTLLDFLGIPASKLITTLVYDGKDFENYLAYLYNGRQRFQSLSPNFNDCIKLITKNILGIDKKQVEKLFAKAKKAKKL